MTSSGERKLVSVIFADLTGYTALAASLDPEEVYRFLRPTMTELVGIAEGYGGTVPQVMGDGFMAVFGVPAVHEDDAERAVRAALAIRDHVRQRNETSDGLAFPEVHAGVNSGEVMVVPADEQAGFRIVGDTVNVASRLADLASPGRVLVEEGTKHLTEEAIAYGPRRLRRAKGKRDPIATFEASFARASEPRRSRAGLTMGSFVNRQTEMAHLDAEMQRAQRSHRSRVLLVSAEPGLGKSRLAEEFAGRLPAARVFSGHCVPFGQRRPLAALAEAVGSAIGVGRGKERNRAAASLPRLVRQLVGAREDLAGLTRDLGVLLGLDRPSVGRPDTVESATRAARAVMEHLAQDGPVLVTLDDLHWADADLLRAIETVHEAPWLGPILFLCLMRPESSVSTLPSIQLEPLDTGASRALAERVLGSDYPDALLRELLIRSGGNPLFLEESLGMLAEAGSIIEKEGRWLVARPEDLARIPATIRLLIAARLDGLPPDEKRLVQVVSVAGEAVWDRLLERISDAENVRVSIRALEARDLIRRRRPSLVAGAAEYELKHVLIRDVAYESLPRAERAQRHLQIASWLGETSGLREEPVALLAHHYERAWELSRSRTGPGPPAQTGRLAVTLLRRWADDTLAYQARSAESLYGRALRIAQELGASLDPGERARVLVGHAEALEEMGRHREALENAIYAGRSGKRAGDRAVLARALLARGRTEQSRPLLQRALALFEEVGDVAGQGWAHLRISETWAEEDYRQELEYLRRSYDLFERAGNRWGRSVVAQDLAYLLTVMGGAQFRHWYEESRRLTSDEGDLRSRAALLRTWGYFEHYRGDHLKAIRVMQEARPLAVEAGDRYIEADTLLIESMARTSLGPQPEAEAIARSAVRLGRDIESERVVALGLLASARAAVRSGEPHVASRRLRKATKMLQPPTRLDMLDAHLVTAQIQLDRGAWDAVPGSAEQLLVRVRANGWSLWEPMASLLVGRAHLVAGHYPEAASPLTTALATARSAGARGTHSLASAVRDQALIMSGLGPRSRKEPDGPPEVAATRLENLGLVALRDPASADDAGALFSAAVARWQEVGVTAWLARALAFQSEAERRSGRRTKGYRLDAKARSVLEALKTPRGPAAALLHPFGV